MVRKITEPGDWATGTPAGTDLPPRGQPGRREGSPTKLRRKVGQELMEVVAWAQEKNQKAKFNCVPGWAGRPVAPRGRRGPLGKVLRRLGVGRGPDCGTVWCAGPGGPLPSVTATPAAGPRPGLYYQCRLGCRWGDSQACVCVDVLRKVKALPSRSEPSPQEQCRLGCRWEGEGGRPAAPVLSLKENTKGPHSSHQKRLPFILVY